jgi:membrane-bound metal-dependent hydrolase YbcI (DUF457 family)
LVGNIIKEAGRLKSVKDKVVVITFAVLPDIPGLLIVYPLLGHEKGRPWWFPHNADWVGAYAAHPFWAAIWEIPHSLFFLAFVIVPLVLWLDWPKIAIVSYLSHILLDLPTHTGEWAERPFYPFGITVQGFTDAWAWPLSYWLVSWVVLLLIAYLVRYALRKKLC